MQTNYVRSLYNVWTTRGPFVFIKIKKTKRAKNKGRRMILNDWLYAISLYFGFVSGKI